eukprot:scaffold52888_cov70-Phaeocystis_antarctica.AAC.6
MALWQSPCALHAVTLKIACASWPAAAPTSCAAESASTISPSRPSCCEQGTMSPAPRDVPRHHSKLVTPTSRSMKPSTTATTPSSAGATARVSALPRAPGAPEDPDMKRTVPAEREALPTLSSLLSGAHVRVPT